MLARSPFDDGWHCHADETAGEALEGCAVKAMDEIGANLRCEEAKKIDCAGGDEVVPFKLLVIYFRLRVEDGSYQEERRKSQ